MLNSPNVFFCIYWDDHVISVHLMHYFMSISLDVVLVFHYCKKYQRKIKEERLKDTFWVTGLKVAVCLFGSITPGLWWSELPWWKACSKSNLLTSWQPEKVDGKEREAVQRKSGDTVSRSYSCDSLQLTRPHRLYLHHLPIMSSNGLVIWWI